MREVGPGLRVIAAMLLLVLVLLLAGRLIPLDGVVWVGNHPCVPAIGACA